MRKFIFSICLFSLTLIASAQLTSNTGKFFKNFSGIDSLVVFKNITGSGDIITYTGPGITINWYKFSNPTVSISNVADLSPEDATGYILNVDGVIKKRIWVINYKNYTDSTLYSIQPENNPTAQCEQVKLFITAPTLTYNTPDGISHPIQRNFTIKYQTLSWSGAKWNTKDTIQTVILPATQKSVPAPYSNTTFKLSGDQFTTALGIDSIKRASSLYTTNAVICRMTSNVVVRDSTNEIERPKTPTQLNGSAPLDIQFLSNGNEPVTSYYNWSFYKDNATTAFISRTDRDERYTFTDAGRYKVKVTASNSLCSHSDSMIVNVSESFIQSPNVFTPNGDGMNDQFRVAYKSITSFQCWVYNRWGRQVYMWTDPAKGWDGKINGKDAVPGPYFYVIKAKGSDFDPKSTPDSRTHMRLGEYLLKGDINLLRGVK